MTNYEINGERWSLAALDKQIARRQDDTRIIPQRAMRLDLRSLARLNYSTSERGRAGEEAEHLRYVRSEVIREIERRREPLIADRDLAREMLDVLELAHESEERTRSLNGETMPEATYKRYQMNSLEASAETLRDPQLLREVQEWEMSAAQNDRQINWEGRAVAREIMAGIAVQETKERLDRFVESKKFASLNLGDNRTGTLREVQARTLTDYLARAIDSREYRDYRHSISQAAHEHQGRLLSDFERAQEYHQASRELASGVSDREPQFTDKERINLEIYAERQDDDFTRESYLDLARGDSQSHERESAVSLTR